MKCVVKRIVLKNVLGRYCETQCRRSMNKEKKIRWLYPNPPPKKNLVTSVSFLAGGQTSKKASVNAENSAN